MKQANHIVLEPTTEATSTVIFLHGLGDTGSNLANIVPLFNLPPEAGIRFVFPTAPIRPITLNAGMPMPGWYDIYGLTAVSKEDESGVLDAERFVHQLIQEQQAQGIALDRIVLAGFSQGGAVALFTGARYTQKLAGVLGLSAYLPVHYLIKKENAQSIATPFALMHGEQDNIVPPDLGYTSYQYLHDLGFDVSWNVYPMAHEITNAECCVIGEWLVKRCGLFG